MHSRGSLNTRPEWSGFWDPPYLYSMEDDMAIWHIIDAKQRSHIDVS